MTIKVHESSISTLVNQALFLILITCLSLSSNSYAMDVHPAWLQESFEKIDQLNKKDPALALEQSKKLMKNKQHLLSGSGKAALFTRMAQHYYILGDLVQSNEFVQKTYTLSPDLTHNTGILLLLTHGAIVDEQGNAEKAMALYFQAEENAKETENTKMLADTYSYMASSYALRHNNIEALRYFHQSYLLLEQLGDKLELAYLKVQMSKSYSYLNDDEKAISLAKEAISYFSNHQLFFDEIFAQNALARSYVRVKEFVKAEQSFQKVINLSLKLEKESYAFLGYMGLAKIYNYLGNNQKARTYWQKYQQQDHVTLTTYEKLDNFLLEAKLELAENNTEQAEKLLQHAQELLTSIEQDKTLFWQIALLDLQTEIAILNKDFQSGYLLQKQARELQKSYNNLEREKIRSKYKVMFETDQTLLKNQILIKDNKLDKIALENSQQRQWIQRLIIIAISLFAMLLSFFIYRQIKTSKTLHKLANTDSLTELANRRFTFAYAEEQIERSIKMSQAFSIIIFDIDHFKSINDTYGHSSGDIALKALSTLAGEYVRAQDILGRIGGEEFLLILPNTSAQQAHEIAERIRQAIEVHNIELQDHTINITASFGVAQQSSKHDNFNLLFNDADLALYQAKEQGRNKVIIANY